MGFRQTYQLEPYHGLVIPSPPGAWEHRQQLTTRMQCSSMIYSRHKPKANTLPTASCAVTERCEQTKELHYHHSRPHHALLRHLYPLLLLECGFR